MKHLAVIFAIVCSFAAANAYNYVKCTGNTKSGKTLVVDFCIDRSVATATEGKEGQVVKCDEDDDTPLNMAVINKVNKDATQSGKAFEVGSASFWVQTDDSINIFVTDYNGDAEGVDLEAKGYKTISVSIYAETPDSFSFTLQEKGWNGYSFGNGDCTVTEYFPAPAPQPLD